LDTCSALLSRKDQKLGPATDIMRRAAHQLVLSCGAQHELAPSRRDFSCEAVAISL